MTMTEAIFRVFVPVHAIFSLSLELCKSTSIVEFCETRAWVPAPALNDWQDCFTQEDLAVLFLNEPLFHWRFVRASIDYVYFIHRCAASPTMVPQLMMTMGLDWTAFCRNEKLFGFDVDPKSNDKIT